jgi:salicylate hydroxylase
MFALEDGPEQEARDKMLRAGEDYPLFQWLWGYNAAESGKEAWKRFLNKADSVHEDDRVSNVQGVPGKSVLAY